jgi:hypothetical protein
MISHSWFPVFERYAEDSSISTSFDEREKYKLVVDGIEKVMTLYAPDMNRCYIWVDFTCIPAFGKLEVIKYKTLHLCHIMEHCDLVYTFIHDLVEPPMSDEVQPGSIGSPEYKEHGWEHGSLAPFSHLLDPPTSLYTYYDEYKSMVWKVGPLSYLNSAWARVEMFFGSQLPLFQVCMSLF